MRVLITGAFRFPDGDAAASRVLGIAELLARAGATVRIAGWEARADGASSYRHAAFDCFPQAEFRETALGPITRLIGFLLRGSRTLRWMRGQPRFDAIVLYNPPALFAARVLSFCRTAGSVAVLDSTEWYESAHLPGGRFGVASCENWLRMKMVYPRFGIVLCISKFLEAYFSGRRTLRVPPLMPPEVDEAALDASGDALASGLRLVYAGQAGAKDQLAPVIRMLPALQQGLGCSVRLTLAGTSPDEFASLCGSEGIDLMTVRSQVVCLGRVSRRTVFSLYSTSHFSVVFRRDQRYARAGFPTKAMESWAVGCPIICNRIGELATLGVDGETVLFVEPDTVGEELLRRLHSWPAAGYSGMRSAARDLAQREFSPDNFLPQFATLLEEIRRTTRKACTPTIEVERSAS